MVQVIYIIHDMCYVTCTGMTDTCYMLLSMELSVTLYNVLVV